ncbi:uncharacterized protein F5Z01DRAFT_120455 [Emericellopsis atlantica]|uniref:Gfo/Idh/MocA-like oxidoreductase N-terminal domain-containing protein n=1 Tax=Emericellopsis atlantica TaxID=2614577 RepID=A0A9P7ZM17_9HYPO|nr:uncharacterized protein F5Z01DRAFT_120455 [Emericellopsis atlantica]KAG9254177.1 hypothetical protein F5Z01DRAFT_120455 [Emericellopsis atlantica]
MAPLRVALIGLSGRAKTGWASSAHLPYFLSPRGRESYSIVALCNSSVEAAKQAIKAYNLPSTTKAYGDPQSVADDQDVDLVVCCTRVDVHHPTILPSVKAGKSVYVEWPLAQDVVHATELVEAAESSGSKTIMGMQGRVAPPVVKIKEIIEQGRLGKILSSEVRAAGGSMDRLVLSSDLSYFTDRSIGGNVYTIGFGHLFDQVQYVLGTIEKPQTRLQLQRPEVKLRDPKTQNIVDTVISNVPDLVIVAATMPKSESVQENASILLRFRRGQPVAGEPALVWTISGTKGDLVLVARGGTALHANAYSEPVTIEIYNFETDKVEHVEWTWEDWQAELPMVARSIGKVYEDFANGAQVPTFKDALERHEQLEGYLEDWRP